MKEARYRQIFNLLKEKIQIGTYPLGSKLPSENELCKNYNITRTTARRALEELVREGFIERARGKRSIVKERRQSLGLLAIKGFSEAAGANVQTIMLNPPVLMPWPMNFWSSISKEELSYPCIFFRRLRKIKGQAVMYESNWFSSNGIEDIMEYDFVDGSFFKTLSQNYLIEITGSSQELHAINAEPEIANKLEIEVGAPVLQICIKFTTSKPLLNIYARLYCNTNAYPIRNTHKL